MSLNYTFKVEDNLLTVRASGKGNNLEEVLNYTKAVIGKAIENQSHFIFCDERELSHDLGVVDTVLLAEKTKAAAPDVAKVAILYDKGELDKGEFYETVTANRGLSIFVTDDKEKAMDWLKLKK